VESVAGALVVRKNHGSPTPPKVASPAGVTAAPNPAGLQVTPLPSANPGLPPPTPPALATPALPPQPPAVAQQVHWSVRSQPSGALVLDASGAPLGQTPLWRELTKKEGAQTIILRLPGYRDAQLSLSQNSDEEREAELVAVTPPGKNGGPGPVRNFSKRGGKQRAGQGKHTADDTTILLDFKTKKVLKTQ